jgi:hypothetical protein
VEGADDDEDAAVVGVAVVVGWFLLPASLESLSVPLGGLAAELKVLPLPPGDVLKLVGGAADEPSFRGHRRPDFRPISAVTDRKVG